MTTSWKESTSKRLVLDNGSFNLRIGVAGQKESRFVGRNMIASHKRNSEVLACDKVDSVMKEASYRYSKPHVRGVLTNFDIQMNIWNKQFGKYVQDKNYKNWSLTISTPCVLPLRSKEKLMEVLFEYYGFGGVSFVK